MQSCLAAKYIKVHLEIIQLLPFEYCLEMDIEIFL